MVFTAINLDTFFLLLNQNHIFYTLIIVALFFGVILIFGIRKSYLLKKENDKLSNSEGLMAKDDDYKDFRDGHLYDNN